MRLLDGKEVSAKIKEDIKRDAAEFTAAAGRKPHLVAILVGNDGGSETYVASKMRNCELVGFESTNIRYGVDITEEELIAKIEEINKDESIDGLIVQLPLPKHINEQKILMAIDPDKDVDGFHPTNFGRMALELEAFIPATPFGILQLLDRNKIDTKGKHVVVIGRSNIVGRPMSILMSQKGMAGNATVTLAHSHTHNLNELCLQADIIITALGVPEFLKAEMVKEGAVIVDVGITRVPDATNPKGYVIKGDVDFENVKQKASWITPVPGGVGPMTIAMVLENVLEGVKKNG